MTIALTSDQTDLAEAVAGFTARHADVSATRAAFDKIASGEPQSSWQALVEQRLHAIHLPEWAGGDGASLVELAVVVEETAFGLLPGPLLPTVLASQLITAHAPQALASRLLPAFAGGATAASAVAATGLRATRVTGGWRVAGQTAPVLGAASARVLVLGATPETGASQGGALWMVLDGATLGNERVNIATGSVSKGSVSRGTGQRNRLPSAFIDDLPGPVPDEVRAEAGALTAEALAFAAMSQRLLLRQIAGLRRPAGLGHSAEASVLKVISAANVASLRRAVLDWHGAAAAALTSPSHDYLSVPPQLIGGGTVEIQLNVIGERVLGLPR